MSSPLLSQRIADQTHVASRKRSVAAEVVRIVRRIAATDGFQFDQFLSYLNKYQLTRTTLLVGKPNGAEKVQAFTLYCYAIRVCLEGFQSQSIESLCFDLEGLFSQHRLD